MSRRKINADGQWAMRGKPFLPMLGPEAGLMQDEQVDRRDKTSLFGERYELRR